MTRARALDQFGSTRTARSASTSAPAAFPVPPRRGARRLGLSSFWRRPARVRSPCCTRRGRPGGRRRRRRRCCARARVVGVGDFVRRGGASASRAVHQGRVVVGMEGGTARLPVPAGGLGVVRGALQVAAGTPGARRRRAPSPNNPEQVARRERIGEVRLEASSGARLRLRGSRAAAHGRPRGRIGRDADDRTRARDEVMDPKTTRRAPERESARESTRSRARAESPARAKVQCRAGPVPIGVTHETTRRLTDFTNIVSTPTRVVFPFGKIYSVDRIVDAGCESSTRVFVQRLVRVPSLVPHVLVRPFARARVPERDGPPPPTSPSVPLARRASRGKHREVHRGVRHRERREQRERRHRRLRRSRFLARHPTGSRTTLVRSVRHFDHRAVIAEPREFVPGASKLVAKPAAASSERTREFSGIFGAATPTTLRARAPNLSVERDSAASAAFGERHVTSVARASPPNAS